MIYLYLLMCSDVFILYFCSYVFIIYMDYDSILIIYQYSVLFVQFVLSVLQTAVQAPLAFVQFKFNKFVREPFISWVLYIGI